MHKPRNPQQIARIVKAAEDLVAVIRPATDQDGMLQEWPELSAAVVKLATALGMDLPMPSPSATQPIATQPIFDTGGHHIGYWRLCQHCHSPLPDTTDGTAHKVRGAVFCSAACLDAWASAHPARHGRA
jgi:hypothetical protein